MKKRIKFKASYTIEAALLFPFILSVIVLVIYGAFFIHDRAVLDAAAYEAALRGSEVTDKSDDIYAKVKKTGEDTIDGRLLATKDLDMDIQITKDQVSVRYSGEFSIPGGVVLVPGMSFSGIGVRAEGHSKRLDPGNFIRECRIVENLVK